MKLHSLKCWPVPFEAARSGEKTYEVRAWDRDFAVGDVVILREWDPDRAFPSRFTPRMLVVQIAYLTAPGTWGLPLAAVDYKGRVPVRSAVGVFGFRLGVLCLKCNSAGEIGVPSREGCGLCGGFGMHLPGRDLRGLTVGVEERE